MPKGKKPIIIVVGLLAVVGIGYKETHKPKEPVPKIKGTIYELPKSFLVNLQGSHYAKLMVALDLAPGQEDGVAKGATPSAEEGPGTLPEEPVVRSIITNVITGLPSGSLVGEHGRRKIEKRILDDIKKQTDVKTEQVLFPEITVQ